MKSSDLVPPINGRVKHLLLLTTVLFAALHSVIAEGFNERDDYGVLLEPAGKVINGAGPTPVAFENYWNVMGDNNKPMVYMDYVRLKGITESWPNKLKAEILKYQPMFVIPQIGLPMSQDGDPNMHYEDDVAAGLYDGEIDIFLTGLEELAMPVYLRIGYEFNGRGKGYQPSTYIDAFQYITEKIRERDLEVATVWDATADGVYNYYDYYPGDQYVDWWGINTFVPGHFQGIGFPTLDFLDQAAAHNKPVMIGESTPRGTGALGGEDSWNEWFVPYFQFMHSHPGIKMFCYIDFNWMDYTKWEDWGDCRIEQNDYVSGHFADEMTSSLYLHATSEHDFRQTLGYNDNTAPPVITKIVSDDSSYPALLQWDAVTDSSGLAHYIIYQDCNIVGYTLKPRFICSDVIAGDIVDYYVTAMDRAGNESPRSETVRVVIPHSIPKTINGEFDDGFDGWNQNVWSGSADFSIDTSSTISGPNTAHINISLSPGIDWEIQLRQFMKIHKGRKYTISYKARANKDVILKTRLQMDHAPRSNYIQKFVSLTPEVQSFTHSAIIDADDDVYLAFMMGDFGEAEVWIDAVSVTEEKSRTDLIDFSLLASEWLQCNRTPRSSCLMDVPTPTNTPPVAHWKLDEVDGNVASDSAGNNHGELHGDPVWRPTGGIMIGSLELDGVNDYVDCGTEPNLNITEAVTVTAWIKLAAIHVDQKIAGKQDNIAGGYKMGLISDGKVEFEIRDANNKPILNRGFPGGTVLQPGLWYHVTGVYSEGEYIRTYVNGILDREMPTSAILAPTLGKMVLGRAPFINHSFFDGCIDDVRVYDRALSENEIVTLLCVKEPVADYNGDCKVDWKDLNIFASLWLN